MTHPTYLSLPRSTTSGASLFLVIGLLSSAPACFRHLPEADCEGAECAEPPDADPARLTSTRIIRHVPVDGDWVSFGLPELGLFRLSLAKGTSPQNVSEALARLDPSEVSGNDGAWLSMSSNADWLLFHTARFDPECVETGCLAIANGDISDATVIRADGQVIEPAGYSAIGNNGDLIVFSKYGGSHTQDLFATRRDGDTWTPPIELTTPSTFAYNAQPALSRDGSKVLFDCGDFPYGDVGTAICEVNTDGSNYRVVTSPDRGPSDAEKSFIALHHPTYSADGSILFESNWYGGEQIWIIGPDATPKQTNDVFSNDNSPCGLPNGDIVSLWLARPGSTGTHEIKQMDGSGGHPRTPLVDVDVIDVGLSCGG